MIIHIRHLENKKYESNKNIKQTQLWISNLYFKYRKWKIHFKYKGKIALVLHIKSEHLWSTLIQNCESQGGGNKWKTFLSSTYRCLIFKPVVNTKIYIYYFEYFCMSEILHFKNRKH